MSTLHRICALLLALATASAGAGGLSVLPTRLDFNASRNVQAVLLTNTSAQTVTVETQVLVWPEGAPGQLANDIVVSPAVVTLAPDQRVRLRVGLLRPQDPAAERAYRLYFTELPVASPLQGAGIGVRLRIGIPLFVAPAQAAPQPLRWLARQGAGGWELVAHNPGNVHTRLASLRLSDRSAPLALNTPYVLAGATLVVPFGAADAAAAAGPAADARVRWQEGADDRESPLAPGP